MQLLVQAIAICSLLTFSIALSPPPWVSTSQNRTTLNNAPSANLTTRSRPHCSGIYYGYDLNKESCENAWAKIDQSATSGTYHTRPRSTGEHVDPPDVVLPARYLSDDGVCAIDVKIKPGSTWDVTSGLEIAAQAGKILDSCLHRADIGGSITGFSM